MNSIFEDRESDDDLFDSLLKRSRTTRNRTTVNADFLEIEQNSYSQPLKEQINSVVDFQNSGKGRFEDERQIQIEEDVEEEKKRNQGDWQEEKEENEEKRGSLEARGRKQKIEKGEERQIFRRKTIVKEGKKNTNLPKFFVRILMKYYQQYSESNQAIQQFQNLASEMKNRKTNNFNISDLLLLFTEQKGQINKESRLTMRKILRSKLKQEIILNSYVTNNRLTYMMTAKVFSLRSASKQLTHRLQFR